MSAAPVQPEWPSPPATATPLEAAVATARLRASVTARLTQGIGAKERLNADYVAYCIETLDDRTLTVLGRALFSSPSPPPEAEVRGVLRAGASDRDAREYIALRDCLPPDLSAPDKVAHIRGLHRYGLEALQTEDLSEEPEATRALCRTLLRALQQITDALPIGPRRSAVVYRAAMPKAVFLSSPDLVRLIADYPDRLQEIVHHIEQRGDTGVVVLRERFENAPATLGEGWL